MPKIITTTLSIDGLLEAVRLSRTGGVFHVQFVIAETITRGVDGDVAARSRVLNETELPAPLVANLESRFNDIEAAIRTRDYA